jgi:hypothetical protein
LAGSQVIFVVFSTGRCFLCRSRLLFGREFLLDFDGDGVGVHFVDGRGIAEHQRRIAARCGWDAGSVQPPSASITPCTVSDAAGVPEKDRFIERQHVRRRAYL